MCGICPWGGREGGGGKGGGEQVVCCWVELGRVLCLRGDRVKGLGGRGVFCQLCWGMKEWKEGGLAGWEEGEAIVNFGASMPWGGLICSSAMCPRSRRQPKPHAGGPPALHLALLLCHI